LKKFLTGIYLFFAVSGFAQSPYSFNDAQMWFNLYLEKKVTDHWSAHLNQQDRWTENVSQFNFAYADMGLTYKLNKHIKFLGDYVFTQKRRDDGSFGTVHQYYIAGTYKYDYMRWRFMYRLMYQFQFNNPYTSFYGLDPFHYLRNKFIVKYEYNKYFQFYAAEELYLPLNSPQINGFDRNRTFVGLFYNTFKNQQLEIYFMYQNRIQNGEWFKQKNSYDATNFILEKDFVYGIGYSFDF
jgi:hypothetical protein